MSVGSNPTTGVDISNEQGELLLEMKKVEELLMVWLKLERKATFVKVTSDEFGNVIRNLDNFIFKQYSKLSEFWLILSEFRITLSFIKTHILNRKKETVLPSLPKGTDLLSKKRTTLITNTFSGSNYDLCNSQGWKM